MIRLAVVSDTHLGFHQRNREKEAFEQAKEAFNLALSFNPDAILMPGDFFDKEEPLIETYMEAVDLLLLPKGKSSPIKTISKESRQGVKSNYSFQGIPVIAIAGTHEYRNKDSANAVQLLEKAGFLLYLHADKAVIQKDNLKVAVHGLSGLPEKMALNALKIWNPQKEHDAYNILMLHQSFKDFLPFDDEMIASLSLSDMPDFNLILNGHFHWHSEIKEGKKHLVIPGSTIITQTKKLESEKKKGILLIEVHESSEISPKISFHELKKQRLFLYKEIPFNEANSSFIVSESRNAVQKLLDENPSEEKPILKLVLKGSMAKGLKKSDLLLTEIAQGFEENTLLFLSNRLNQESFKEKISNIADKQQKAKSIKELSSELLQKNLEKNSFGKSFDAEEMAELFAEGKTEEALKKLVE